MLSETNKKSQSEWLLDSESMPATMPKFATWKRAICLAIGCSFTLTLIAVIVALALNHLGELDRESAENFIAYSVIFFGLLAVVGNDIPVFIKLFKRWQPYVVGLGIAVGVIFFDNVYSTIINLFYPYVETSGNEIGIRDIIGAYPAISFFVFGFIGPMCEELAYRVGLFGLCRKVNRVFAYCITGLIFGLIHFDYTSADILAEFLFLPSYIVPGLLFSLAYDLYGLPCSFTAHSINNVYAVVMTIMRNYIK